MRRIASIFVLCLLTSFVWADGCYIPAKAILKIPEIPAQQAVVSWKDGMETLVIASALDSESQKLGWIIPLPSVPDTLEKGTPGSLKTLNFCLQPTITHDLLQPIFWSLKLLFLALLIIPTGLYKPDRLVDLLLVLLVFFVLSASFFSAGGSHLGNRATHQRSVEVEKTARVGAYDISVLRSKDTEGLKEWLTDNGFATIPATAQETIAAYIREGWVFAAIALSREDTGASTPHPIKIIFKASAPVYPMRLTAVAGGNTALDLFVIADKRAASDLLKTTFCDQFTSTTNIGETNTVKTTPGYKAIYSNIEIGHPAVCELMWPGCVLTKLSGVISSNKMTEDIRFTWKPFEACRQHFYTTFGAKSVVFLICLWGIGGSLLICMILFKQRIFYFQGFKWFFKKVITPITLAVVLTATLFYMAAPKLKADAYSVSFRHPRVYPGWLKNRITMQLKENPTLLNSSEQEIAKGLLDLIAKDYTSAANRKQWMSGNRLTGGPLQIEDSPGNFTIQKKEDHVIVRIYDATGRAFTEKLNFTPPTPSTP